MGAKFRVGVTRDTRMPDGSFVFSPVDLELLDRAPGIEWEFLAEDLLELTPELVRGYDALFHFSPDCLPLGPLARRALRRHGHGPDVFEREPVPDGSPLLGLENVVAGPHALGYTEPSGFPVCRHIASRQMRRPAAA